MSLFFISDFIFMFTRKVFILDAVCYEVQRSTRICDSCIFNSC